MKFVILVLLFSLVHAMAFKQDFLEHPNLKFDLPLKVASPDKLGSATAMNRDTEKQDLKNHNGAKSLVISREHLKWILQQLKGLGDVKVQNHQNLELSRVDSNEEKGNHCSSQSCLRAVFWKNKTRE